MDYLKWLSELFPLVVENPYNKNGFLEINDYMEGHCAVTTVVIVLFWAPLILKILKDPESFSEIAEPFFVQQNLFFIAQMLNVILCWSGHYEVMVHSEWIDSALENAGCKNSICNHNKKDFIKLMKILKWQGSR